MKASNDHISPTNRLRIMLLLLSFVALAYGSSNWIRRPPTILGSGRSPSAGADHRRRHNQIFHGEKVISKNVRTSLDYRGGGSADRLNRPVATVVDLVAGACRLVLPPLFGCARLVGSIYRQLPRDAIVAQVGLVYCFAGGYYPTLFSALQAARHCGWEQMLDALEDLTEEAVLAIDATKLSEYEHDYGEQREGSTSKVLAEKTLIVLKTIDPMKINQALAALYTCWLGVSTVLEREYASVISMSITISDCLEPISSFLLGPPLRFCISKDYQRWIPFILGWICKGVAMTVTWRIQRVVTAYTSAVAGGLMFSRACFRMLTKRKNRFLDSTNEIIASPLSWICESLGLLVGGCGLFAQIQTQIKHNFSFQVPFPISLVTWPFGLAERWIQWQITKQEDNNV